MDACVVNYDENTDEYQTLVDELKELRRIAALNIIRAADILERHKDEEVAQLLVSEAALMLIVVNKVEHLIGVEPPDDNNDDANL
jgi:hypothetical protein